eukprot:TRINITY_DN2220_c0_g2_i1.p1 TRINITY_DN2220_c0_g2~~TRINITY_DN2220_c0_g2_i1.p1  ORF type:complete len:349 (-),score=97.99 TRINITY_DN2220_c0_g2_i1:47-1093(-)
MLRSSRLVYVALPFGARGVATNSGIVATVFGATGFTGRYVVEQLAEIGATVIVPFRGEEKSYKHLKTVGQLGQIVPLRVDYRDVDTLKRAVAPANVVINLMNRFWETKNFSFEDVNVTAAKVIAENSKHTDRFIHVSAAGVSTDSASKWASTKARGEEAVKEILPWATVIKPTRVFGDEDRMLTRWARMSLYPRVPVSDEVNRLVQPISAADFARTIIGALGEAKAIGQTYTVGGPKVYTWGDIVQSMIDCVKRGDKTLHVPPKMLETIASISEYQAVLGVEPMWTRSEFQHILENDLTVPPGELGAADLGLKRLQSIDSMLLKIARIYRDPNHQSEFIEQNPPVPSK